MLLSNEMTTLFLSLFFFTGLFDKRGENHSGREDGESSSLGTASNNESTSNFSQYSDYSKKLMVWTMVF